MYCAVGLGAPLWGGEVWCGEGGWGVDSSVCGDGG